MPLERRRRRHPAKGGLPPLFTVPKLSIPLRQLRFAPMADVVLDSFYPTLALSLSPPPLPTACLSWLSPPPVPPLPPAHGEFPGLVT